ncbi:MAG: hypothetical protein V1914_04055 [archaeon]
MNKKGANHIDWAVSMGIFLVYILSMFILIQPGIQPFYSEDNLFQVVESQLDLDLDYEILRAPIYLDIISGAFPAASSGVYIQTELTDFGLNPDMSDLRFVYITPEGQEVEAPFLVKNGFILFNSPYPLQSQKIEGTHTFVIYYSKDKFKQTLVPTLSKLFEKKIITPGTIEHLKGINERELKDFATLNCSDLESYEELKEAWNFPIGKEFSLYYVTTEKLPYDMNKIVYLCNQVRPYDQSDVFVKEWSDWILNINGTLAPIIFNLQVW